MSTKRKILTIGGVSLLIFGLIFFGKNIFVSLSYTDKTKRDIFDNDDKITSQWDSYSYLYCAGENKDSETDLAFRFTGMDTIWKITSENNVDILMKYDSQISHGNFKVVLIDTDGKIINLSEQSMVGEKIVTLKKGENRIKIVGKDAKGQFKLKIESNGLVTLNPENH